MKKNCVEKFKIRETASLLINSDLPKRDQYVICGEYLSDVFTVNVGVPYRSVLGLLLFLFLLMTFHNLE